MSIVDKILEEIALKRLLKYYDNGIKASELIHDIIHELEQILIKFENNKHVEIINDIDRLNDFFNACQL